MNNIMVRKILFGMSTTVYSNSKFVTISKQSGLWMMVVYEEKDNRKGLVCSLSFRIFVRNNTSA